jgi:hypothetical protein
MRAVIHVEVQCSEKVMDMHLEGFRLLLTKYLTDQHYSTNKFKVEVTKNMEPRTAAGSLD